MSAAMNSILSSIFSPRKELPDAPRVRPQPSPKTTPKTTPKSTPKSTLNKTSGKKQQVLARRASTGGRKETVATPIRKPAKSQPLSAVALRETAGSIAKGSPAKSSTQKPRAEQRITGGLSHVRADDVDDANARLLPTPAASKRTSREAPKRQLATSDVVKDKEEEDATQKLDLEKEQEDEHDDEYVFKRLSKYRWAGNSIEVQVEWAQGDVTWEPEANLHEDVPESLFAFWDRQGGRPTNPSDPDLYDIFAIRKHSKDRKWLLVEWVGYGPKDATWVSRVAVEETAPDVVAEYWARVKPAAKKRQTKR